MKFVDHFFLRHRTLAKTMQQGGSPPITLSGKTFPIKNLFSTDYYKILSRLLHLVVDFGNYRKLMTARTLTKNDKLKFVCS